MKITIPQGFEIPLDADEEGIFQVVATFKDNGDGTINLIEVDGAEIEGDDDEEEEEVVVAKAAPSLFQRAQAAGVPMKG